MPVKHICITQVLRRLSNNRQTKHSSNKLFSFNRTGLMSPTVIASSPCCSNNREMDDAQEEWAGGLLYYLNRNVTYMYACTGTWSLD